MPDTVADVMTWTSLILRPDCPAKFALESLVAAESLELFVVDEQDRFLGIVTDFELLKADLNGSLEDCTVDQLMQSRPVTLSPEAPLAEAARLFRDGSLARIPILRDGRLLGMIVRRDVLRWLTMQRAERDGATIQPPKFLKRSQAAVDAESSI